MKSDKANSKLSLTPLHLDEPLQWFRKHYFRVGRMPLLCWNWPRCFEQVPLELPVQFAVCLHADKMIKYLFDIATETYLIGNQVRGNSTETHLIGNRLRGNSTDSTWLTAVLHRIFALCSFGLSHVFPCMHARLTFFFFKCDKAFKGLHLL